MPIDTRVHLFVKPSSGLDVNPSTLKMSSSIYYITDVAPERVFCKQDELFRILKGEYGYSLDQVEEIHIKLNCGSPLILNLLEKTYMEIPEELLLRGEIVRGGAGPVANIVEFFEKRHNKSEQIIKKNFFTP